LLAQSLDPAFITVAVAVVAVMLVKAFMEITVALEVADKAAVLTIVGMA
jgi:hypothetical protein